MIWKSERKNPLWKKLNGHYHRSKAGGGDWEFFSLPKEWQISYPLGENGADALHFHLKPFAFKHTGIFPEQAVNWEWFYRLIREEKERREKKRDTTPIKVLNLFAYTGGATLAAAKAGAELTHVDASKGMVSWAKENAELSGLSKAPIRYLVDDCVKFVEREIRRGNLENRRQYLSLPASCREDSEEGRALLSLEFLHNRPASRRNAIYAGRNHRKGKNGAGPLR